MEMKKFRRLSVFLLFLLFISFSLFSSVRTVTANVVLLSNDINLSFDDIEANFGPPTYPNASFGWVHVKDVANAHILAFETPSASGRYLLVERVVHFSVLVKILRELYPDIQLPEKCADENPFVPTYQVNTERTKGLGINFISLEESIKETVESLKQKSFISSL